MDFPHTQQHAVIIDDVIIVGRRLLRTYITMHVCKRVDVYTITLSSTWRIYALSERLLVSSSSDRLYWAYCYENLVDVRFEFILAT